jgi:hypothetical protein
LPPSQQTLADAVGTPARLVLLAHFQRLALTSAEVIFHLRGVAEAVANQVVNISQRNRRVLLGDLFWGRAFVEGQQNRIQRHPCAAYADHAIGPVTMGIVSIVSLVGILSSLA